MGFNFSKLAARRPSPALVISVMALIVAVGGGAFAIAASDNKKDKKIANGVVTSRAPGLSVSHAGSADNATVGGPVAFAAIAADGTVQAAHSRGITQANVTTSAVASYCIKGVPAFKLALTTPGYVSNQPDDVTAKVTYSDFPGAASFGTDCPGAQLDVVTTDNGAFVKEPFFIALYN